MQCGDIREEDSEFEGSTEGDLLSMLDRVGDLSEKLLGQWPKLSKLVETSLVQSDRLCTLMDATLKLLKDQETTRE